MPRGKKIAHQTKYEVLNCVLGYLPERTQARFKAVSADVNSRLKRITPPKYAELLDELQATVCSLPRGSKQITFIDGTEFGLDIKAFGAKKIRIEMGDLQQFRWKSVSTCKPTNIKRVIYRAAAKGKRIAGARSVADVLEHVAETCTSVQGYTPLPSGG